MRIPEPKRSDLAEGDLTPMIDMTFQLIAFFMVLINFTDAEQDQRIRLPVSDIAKPPDTAFIEPRTVHLTDRGMVSFRGDEMPMVEFERHLRRDVQELRNRGKSVTDVTVIIRADKNAMSGQVQEIMQECQRTGYERFVLRAKSPDPGG